MTIIGRKTLDIFKRQHADACSQIDAWEAEVKNAHWSTPHELKQRYPSASILPDNKVVFNIKGNKYRLLVRINYKNQILMVYEAGTHDEYMKWQ
ncbi:MAG: type II toxin-antitoxin system HigB family toxin [Armatimonadota bacterium]